MKRFYLVLGFAALAGGAWLIYEARRPPAVTPAGATAPAPAADGFAGFTMGSDSAPVEVVEYADFECPACAQFATVQMPTVREQLITTGRVRWRFRDFPLPSHSFARYAAHAAQCAGEQGRFWDMHDQLFANHSWAQTGRDPSRLFRDLARGVGLELDRYDACMESGRYAGRIEASKQEGDLRGVNGTPTFFINGRLLTTRSWGSDVFKRAVDSLTSRGR
ncbi:MAG: DsbA family protein [Gemmatimonadales bacterium]